MTRVISREPALRHERGTGAPRTPVEPRIALSLRRNATETFRTFDESGETCVQADAACESTSDADARSLVWAAPNTRGRPASRVLVGIVMRWSDPWLGGCAPGDPPGAFPGSISSPFVNSRGLVTAYASAGVFKRKTQRIRIRHELPYGQEDVTGGVTLDATVRLRRMVRTCRVSGNRARCRDRRA